MVEVLCVLFLFCFLSAATAYCPAGQFLNGNITNIILNGNFIMKDNSAARFPSRWNFQGLVQTSNASEIKCIGNTELSQKVTLTPTYTSCLITFAAKYEPPVYRAVTAVPNISIASLCNNISTLASINSSLASINSSLASLCNNASLNKLSLQSYVNSISYSSPNVSIPVISLYFGPILLGSYNLSKSWGLYSALIPANPIATTDLLNFTTSFMSNKTALYLTNVTGRKYATLFLFFFFHDFSNFCFVLFLKQRNGCLYHMQFRLLFY